MTTTLATASATDAAGNPRTIAVLLDKGDSTCHWRITEPAGRLEIRSFSLPSGGYYLKPENAMRSARRYLKTLS